ncbi:MAG: hypothetical protein KJP23_18430 [Deltaproteobacteria bacterium]|nr:hypothetical protein [Deltaproteobacteria bacterium]
MNQKQIRNIDRRLFRYSSAVIVLLIASLISGCFENYGRLKHNNDITRAFQTYQVEPEYKYYYYGRTNMPYAIIGIDRAYHMRSRIWREVEQDTKKFQNMVFWIWEDIRYAYQRNFTQGAYILDPEGNKVGIWYSGLWSAAIRFDENNRIVVMPETPFMGGP